MQHVAGHARKGQTKIIFKLRKLERIDNDSTLFIVEKVESPGIPESDKRGPGEVRFLFAGGSTVARNYD